MTVINHAIDNVRRLPKLTWLYILSVVSISIITLGAYKPTLFNFLLMDDFGFVIWLKEALSNPSMLVQTFLHSYMNEPNYYRPLITLIWAIECLFWGTNGLYFRLCSIFVMLLSGVTLALITYEFSKRNSNAEFSNSGLQIIWPILCGALFAFYPLHVSAVNWFAAQHAVFVTLFYLLSLYAFIYWRNSSNIAIFILSACSFILALLTEEMAATLPLIILFCELLCIGKASTLNWKRVFRTTFMITLPYWIILSIYLGVRRLAIGTFITKPSGFGYPKPVDMIQAWFSGIQHILVPIDFYTIRRDSAIAIAWEMTIFVLIVTTIYALTASKLKPNDKQTGIFLCLWFFIALLPGNHIFVYEVPNLLNTRVAYLATAPLCAFLTYGIARFSSGFKYSPSASAIAGALLVLSVLLLYANNYAFAYTGHRTNKILTELQKYYRSTAGDLAVKILGLPFINTFHLHLMTKKPFLERDILNCHSLNADDQLFPFGYLKAMVGTANGKTNFLSWSEETQRLIPTAPYRSIPISASFPPDHYVKAFQGTELPNIIHNGFNSAAKVDWLNRGVLHVVSAQRSFLEINLAGFRCWPIDFLSFKLSNSTCGEPSDQPFELHFSNSITPIGAPNLYYPNNTISLAKITSDGKDRELIFSLHSNPYWSLGGKCKELKLLLPPKTNIEISSISLVQAKTIMPTTTGRSFIQLNQPADEELMHYDASSINGCTRVNLEIIGPSDTNKPDIGFEVLNSCHADKNTTLNIPADKPAGTLQIRRSQFCKEGLYKARLRALNKNGEQVGLAGDHFLISVEK